MAIFGTTRLAPFAGAKPSNTWCPRGARRGRWFLLATLALVSFASPIVQGQVRPMVPPLDCCENQYDPCCPSRAANCIPLPTVHVPDDQAYLDPSTAPRNAMSVYEAINIALSNSEVVRNLGLVDANSDNDIIRG